MSGSTRHSGAAFRHDRPVLDPETLAFIDEDLLEEALGIIGAEGVARALPELDSDELLISCRNSSPKNVMKFLPPCPWQNADC